MPLVKLCYTMVHAAEAVGIRDLADGEYKHEDTSLEQGIERQLNYLLDQVGCTRPGFRLLEIGCGYGHLLRIAQARGAQVVGVNISPEQVEYCKRARRAGLLLHIPRAAARPRMARPIRRCHCQRHARALGSTRRCSCGSHERALSRVVRDHAPRARSSDDDARYVTTAIHVKRPVKPLDLLTPWQHHPRGSNERHYSLLHHWMGGWYPVDGQLEVCASPYFSLVAEQDGTLGYKIANDYRLARMTRGLYTNPKLVWRLARSLIMHPEIAYTMLRCYYLEQSWDWQFRSDDPPCGCSGIPGDGMNNKLSSNHEILMSERCRWISILGLSFELAKKWYFS